MRVRQALVPTVCVHLSTQALKRSSLVHSAPTPVGVGDKVAVLATIDKPTHQKKEMTAVDAEHQGVGREVTSSVSVSPKSQRRG